jgi:tyrosine-specific transport protein
MPKVLSTTLIIVGITIGAGVFGLPKALVAFGLLPGLGVLAAVGFVMFLFNQLVVELVNSTPGHSQLPGLAGMYGSPLLKTILSVVMLASLYGGLAAYLLGVGELLSGFTDLSPRTVALVFGVLISFPLIIGFKTTVVLQKGLEILIIVFIAVVSCFTLGRVVVGNVVAASPDWSRLMVTLGVVVFALHGASAIPEAKVVAMNSTVLRRAVMWGTIVPLALYALFSLAFGGALGARTPALATLGLSSLFSQSIALLGILVTVLTLAGAFLGIGTVVKEIWRWDYRRSRSTSLLLMLVPPFLIVLIGHTSFLGLLGLVGGILIASEMVIMVITYWAAVHQGALKLRRGIWYRRAGASLLVVVLALGMLIGTVSSLLAP